LAAKMIAALLLALASGATPALADGVVGDGNPDHCTEAAFDTTYPMAGTITFNCGAAPKTITFSMQKLTFGDTTIDGGGLITLSGGGTTRLFGVPTGARLTLKNIVLEDGNPGAYAGGAVYNFGGTLVLDHVTIQGSHTANKPGGAIHAD